MTKTKAPPDPIRQHSPAAAIERIKQLTTDSTPPPIPINPFPKASAPNPSNGCALTGLNRAKSNARRFPEVVRSCTETATELLAKKTDANVSVPAEAGSPGTTKSAPDARPWQARCLTLCSAEVLHPWPGFIMQEPTGLSEAAYWQTSHYHAAVRIKPVISRPMA
jgi:hypothetical protein